MEIVQQVLAKAEIAALEDKLKILHEKWTNIARGEFNPRDAKSAGGEQKLIDHRFNKMVEADPTSNKAYLQWIITKVGGYVTTLRQLNSIFDENMLKLRYDLELYDLLKKKNKLQGNEKDINQINGPLRLFQLVNPFRQDPDILKSNAQKAKAEEEKFYDNREATLFFDSSDLKVVIPHSHEASMYFGKNTRWCTTMKNDPETFYDYSAAGPLYIILHKPTNRRWQFSFAEGQYMDEMDEEVDWSTFTKEKFIGELRRLFQKEAAQHNMIPLMDTYTDKQAMGYWDRVEDIATDPLAAFSMPLTEKVKDYMVRNLYSKWSIDSVDPLIYFIEELYSDVNKAPTEAKAALVLAVMQKLRVKPAMIVSLIANLWPKRDYPDILLSYLRSAQSKYNIGNLGAALKFDNKQWLYVTERGNSSYVVYWIRSLKSKKQRFEALKYYVVGSDLIKDFDMDEILDFLFHPPFNYTPKELYKAGILNDQAYASAVKTYGDK